MCVVVYTVYMINFLSPTYACSLYLAHIASFDSEKLQVSLTGRDNEQKFFLNQGLLGLFEIVVRCFEMDSAIGIKYTVPRKSSKGNHFLLLLSYVSL